MNAPIPLWYWFKSAIEYATLVYLGIILVFVFLRKARKYDVVIPVAALVLVTAALFRLMAWGRTVVNTDRSLHYAAFMAGVLALVFVYEKIKDRYLR